jgi:hypothetical protein
MPRAVMSNTPGAAKDKMPRWAKDLANSATRRYALATVADRPVPDFLIIGTKRGGTTSLFNYLLMHPGVLGLFPQNRAKKSTDFFFGSNHGLGDEWYRSHFHAERYRNGLRRHLGYRPLSGESSPFYSWDPRIAGRAYQTAPKVKAIMLLRDPVKRAWSHYLERRQNGVEPLSFVDALACESMRLEGELERMASDESYHSDAYDWYGYRSRGDYLPQILNWTSVFPGEQLLVVRSEDMYADVQGLFDRVCAFLDLPTYALPTDRTFNASKPSEVMPSEAAKELRDYFAPRVRELETHLDQPMAWSA